MDVAVVAIKTIKEIFKTVRPNTLPEIYLHSFMSINMPVGLTKLTKHVQCNLTCISMLWHGTKLLSFPKKMTEIITDVLKLRPLHSPTILKKTGRCTSWLETITRIILDHHILYLVGSAKSIGVIHCLG